MADSEKKNVELSDVSDEVLTELTRRIQDIDNSYRAVAEKVGALYIYADENSVAALNRSLDKPMRNASENEQTFSAILEDLRMYGNRRA